MRASFVVLVQVATLAAAACTSQPALPVETTQVTLPASYRFEPAAIRVRAGAAVTWTNRDNFTHDVTLLGEGGWRSQPLRPGDSATYTFATAGEYPYQCSFHPQNMQGRVIVSAP